MPWSLILNWRVVFAVLIATILAASHWKVYVAGKNAVLSQVQAKAMANEQAARAREQQLVAAKHKAEEDHAAFKRRTQRAVAGAQSELGRLRDTLAIRQAAATATPSAGVDAAAAPERELFGQCAETLAKVAQQADHLAAQVIGLQGYVSAVCTAP
jgi:DNA anti-recombination protein RmuC